MSTRARTPEEMLLGPPTQEIGPLRVRIQVLLTFLLVITNVIGAVVVFTMVAIVVPGGGITDRYAGFLRLAVPAYVAVAVVLAATLITARTLKALQWARTEAVPTERQREVALRLPWRITLAQVAIWVVATVFFTLTAARLQPSAVLSTVFSVGIATVVVTAIAYLLAEFSLRPIASRALAGRAGEQFETAGVQRRMVVFWALGTGAPVAGLVVAALVALSRDDVGTDRLAHIMIGLAAVVLVFGALVTILNARAVVGPIASVREGLLEVGRGHLDVEVTVDDGTELGLLQAGFNEMAAGLRERERIRDLFGRHVGESVAAAATSNQVELGGETVDVSVLMIDLVGSTTYATEHTPAEVVAMLNRFFAVVVEEVDRRDGLVNKFMGDAVLAIFGAPVALDDHAGAALSAARAIAARLGEEVPEIGSGIGVATGEAVAGNVGARSRFEYTVIGDAVNSAARLTDLAKEVPGHVLVARRSVDATSADEAARWTDHTTVVLRGRSQETPTAVLA